MLAPSSLLLGAKGSPNVPTGYRKGGPATFGLESSKLFTIIHESCRLIENIIKQCFLT